MKKIIFSLSILAFLAGNTLYAKIVEIEEARVAAKNYYFERLTNNLHRQINYADLVIGQEFIEQSQGVPVYYIFNFSGFGYLILSADDACRPVLAYSFESSWSPENLPESLTDWLYNYQYEINDVRTRNLQPDASIRQEWSQLLVTDPSLLDNTLVTTDVEPLITSLWNQDFPNNGMCPKDAASTGSYYGRVPVGCIATSMSQIMHYWRYPATGVGSHCISPLQPVYGSQCADFSTSTYDWNGMPDQTTLESDVLALLSWHCAIGVDMQFHPDGSGSTSSKTAHALKAYFKYASTTIKYNRYPNYDSWVTLLKDDVDAGKPIQYTGDDNSSGHAFVLDGYQQAGTDYMFHFNWGWGGSYNGYFNINNLTPGGSNFNYNQTAVVHIEPDPAQYPIYCSGNTLVTTNFGSLEDGSGPILDYQNNTDCSWLIAPDDSIDKITLTFTRFNTASGDLVQIYDGDNASAPLLGSFSGSLSTMPSVTSTGPKMFVKFTSDGSLTAQGWRANYSTTLKKFCNANTLMTSSWGHLTDGSGRFNYRNLSNCKWTITPTGPTKLMLTVNSFDTEEENDKLMIYDIGTSALLASLSGSYPTPPAPIISNTNGVLMMWISNNSVRGEGWDIDYSPMTATPGEEGLEDLVIYPNPATDWLNIRLSLTDSKILKVELLSAQGQTLFSDQVENHSGSYEKPIDLSGFPKGVYILHVKTDRSMVTRKIVIR